MYWIMYSAIHFLCMFQTQKEFYELLLQASELMKSFRAKKQVDAESLYEEFK